jgi:hypothetical protein
MRANPRIAWPRFGQPSFVAADPGPPFYCALWPEGNPVMLGAGAGAVLTVAGGSVAAVIQPLLALPVPVLLTACVVAYCKAARVRQAMRDADRRWAREQGMLPPLYAVTAEVIGFRPLPRGGSYGTRHLARRLERPGGADGAGDASPELDIQDDPQHVNTSAHKGE